MADGVTTNYGLVKPEVGASNSTWGTKLNADLDALDAALKVVSDTANAALVGSDLHDAAEVTVADTDEFVILDASDSYNVKNVLWSAIKTAIAAMTATFTNKLLDDATVMFADNSDATKKLAFQLSGFTTATTRTVTFPNADGTVLYKNGDATLSGGYDVTQDGDGTITGSYTPTFAGGNFKDITNGGAITFNPPSGAGTMIIDVVNGASAGAINTSAFTSKTGDAFDTTNGHKFRCYITVGVAGSHIHVTRLV